jgi:hypothetical protein
MKKIFTLSAILISFLSFAQVPQGISYQAIALNGAGNPVVSSNVGVRLSILDNTATGTVLYTETHTKTTSAQGLFNLIIGQGTVVTGTFSSINWGTNSKFLKVELDATGGTTYLLVGTTQLLSVPYAMYAGGLSKTSSNNVISLNNNSGNSIMVVYTDTNAYAFYKDSSTTNQNAYWSSVTLSGNVKGALASNKSIVVYTDTKAYAFYRDSSVTTQNGYWTSVSLSGNLKGAVASNNGVCVYTDTKAFTFYTDNTSTTQNGYWSSTNLLGTVLGAVSSNISLCVYTNTNAYSFYNDNTSTTQNGYWSGISLANIVGASASEKSVLVFSNTRASAFYIDNSTTTQNGYWSSQNIMGTNPNTIKN